MVETDTIMLSTVVRSATEESLQMKWLAIIAVLSLIGASTQDCKLNIVPYGSKGVNKHE